MSYKKRAKEGHTYGKYHKKDSNVSERMYAKQEIRQELNILEAGESYREKGSVRKRTRLEKLTGLLRGIEARKEQWMRWGQQTYSLLSRTFYDSWANKIKEKIGRLKK